MDRAILEQVTALRHQLHMHPELSMAETETKRRLWDFLAANTSLELVDRGGWFYGVHRGAAGGRTIAFRADFDAIAMDEGISLPHGSIVPGVSHKCGHDGHSAILAALAMEVDRSGGGNNLVFLFQPGEETGQGAKVCLPVLEEQGVDAIYALHNWPGYPKGAVGLREGTMFCASGGLVIRYTGANAHASQPETGRNPVYALAQLIDALPGLYADALYEAPVLCTPVHLEAGERAFGIAAGTGSLWLTCRGQMERDMLAAEKRLLAHASALADQHGLAMAVERHEEFPETANHARSVAKVREACRALGVEVVEMERPIRSSEDFGYFTKAVEGAIFLVGSGDGPAVHTAGYDFCDDIIPVSVELLKKLGEIG